MTAATVLAAAGITLLAAASSFAQGAADRTLVPGQRAGAILKATPPGDIAKIYGPAQVKEVKVGYDGDEYPGLAVFQGTEDSIEIVLSEDRKRIWFVRVIGRNWKTASGVRIGTTLAELQRLNGGREFKFNGFDWGLGGLILDDPPNKIAGAGLSEGLGYKNPPPSNRANELEGDRPVSSRHPALRAMNLSVQLLQVEFGQ